MSDMTPEPSAMEAEGIPDIANPDAHGPDSVVEPPHDTAVAVEEFGTTAAELHEGESLDGRLAREEPDVPDQVDAAPDESVGTSGAGQGVGRLVGSDEGARTDTEAETTATDVGIDLGGYTAEESAMHVEPEV